MSRPRGKPSPFTPEQDKHIESFFPALMLGRKAPPKTIVASPLFLGKLATKAQDPVKGGDSSEWKTRIEKKFQNFFNRHQNGSFYFSPLSGIALFELEHRGIHRRICHRPCARTNTSRDLCYQTRRREQWDALDPEKQNDYQSRASSTPANVATNQADFTRSVGKVLTELCRGGQSWRSRAHALWAFRENNGIVQHGMCVTRLLSLTPMLRTMFQTWPIRTPDWDAKFGIPWKDFAEQYIPNANPPSVSRDTAKFTGLTRLSQWSTGANPTSSSLCDCDRRGFRGRRPLWRGQTLMRIRRFTMDIDQFTLPVRLRAPESLGHANIFALAEYFASAKPPFVFRDGGEAVARKAARQPRIHSGRSETWQRRSGKRLPGLPLPSETNTSRSLVPSPEAPKPSHDNRDADSSPPAENTRPEVRRRASKKIKVPAKHTPARITPKRRTVKIEVPLQRHREHGMAPVDPVTITRS
ncbi:hypothetical protein B0H11DRAFT_2337320 [Mycena galericulata]|nr:hypothetical protein B0H11DRAFT_2337320 [Mycena galericulata]